MSPSNTRRALTLSISYLIIAASGLTLGAQPVRAAECDFAGKFRSLVMSTIGEQRALNSTSFKIAIVRPSTGETLCEDSLQAGQNIYPASSIKTLIALATLRRLDRGDVKLDDDVAISQPNAAVECQDWGCSVYGPGKKVKLSKLLWDMITISNNIATNQLIDVASKPFINDTADLLGTPTLRVNRKVYNIQDAEPDVHESNKATAGGYIDLYREIATGKLAILTETSRAYLVNLLRNQQLNDRINAAWPAGTVFFHKTGHTSKATSDAGFFYAPNGDLVIIAGLEAFDHYDDCTASGACTTRTGYQTLKEIGKASLEMIQQMRP